MSYSAPYIDTEGIHVPTYDDILQYFLETYKTIFGLDTYLEPETQDYQLLSIYSRSMSDCMATLVDCYNARNPYYARGASLDLILALNGLTRKRATHSTVILSLTGIEESVITSGHKAIDRNGYLWTLDEDCELDENGEGSVSATCDSAGAVEAPVGTITGIYTTDADWLTVTNETDAIVGSDDETDEEARLRRTVSVVNKGNGTYDALISALNAVPGMKFVNVIVNNTGSTVDSVPAHSICSVVYGGEFVPGSSAETTFLNNVAEAIYKTKAPGVGTYGTTTVNYIDSGGHTNAMKFTLPTRKLVTVTVNLNKLPNYDEDRTEGMIKQSIIDEINNLGVGTSWNVTMAYKDIYVEFGDEDCPFVITSVTGQLEGGSAQSVTVPCAYNEILYVTDNSINIVAT